jgi:D-beta-D-heptose 7-phosphate kinase/D-beta-D-heptose 1-phosphate adenosyltransferase
MKAFCNGCFDLFHYGHLEFLKRASEEADFLWVGLNTDDYILRTKGRVCRPLKERKAILEAIQYVDKVIPFNEDNAVEVMKRVWPDVYCTSEEYEGSPEVQFALQNGIGVRYIPRVGEWSTTRELFREVK